LPRFRQAAVIASLFALVACSHRLPGAAALPTQSDFANNAILAPNQSPAERWRAVEERFAAVRAVGGDCADAACPALRWRALVERLRALPPRERVMAANTELNGVRYVAATTNWGDLGYWETPYEFLARGGQCQDYAIAKYLALAESGLPLAELRFVVVRDKQKALDHAVTIVDLDGESLVLDNQSRDVVSEDAVRARYEAYYAIDAQGWHDYRAPMQIAVRIVAAPAHYY